MRVISLSRTVAAFAALILAGACNDTAGPTVEGPGNTEGMTVEPRNATIQAGQVLQLKAILMDERGDRIDAGISWRSTNDAVAAVSASGAVFARGVGHAVITASALGKSQFSTIHVRARPPKPVFEPKEPGSKGGKPGGELARRPGR